MIILSLVLAVIVFVIIDRQNTTLLEKNAEVLYDIPLSATYNDEEYVVEGLPETVDITLIGTKANLYLAKQLNSYKSKNQKNQVSMFNSYKTRNQKNQVSMFNSYKTRNQKK